MTITYVLSILFSACYGINPTILDSQDRIIADQEYGIVHIRHYNNDSEYYQLDSYYRCSDYELLSKGEL